MGVANQWQGDEPACFAGYLVRLRVNERVASARFVAWWTQSSDFLDQVYAGAVRSTIDNYSAGKYRATTLPLPSLSAQIAVASYLDHETAEIDAFIADQEQLIALLEERRTARISERTWQAGLPDERLSRHVTYLTSGSRGWAEYYADDGDLFLRMANLKRGSFALRLDERQHVRVPEGIEGTRARTRTGDLLLSITAYLGSVGLVTPAASDCFVSQHVALLRVSAARLDSRFLAYALLGSSMQLQLKQFAYGGTKTQLNLDNIRELRIRRPGLEAQQRIANELDAETASIDAAITDARKAIALSKERRAALISAAVTGRNDVTERKRVLI